MSSDLLKGLPSLANESVAKQVTDILTDLIVSGKIKLGEYLPTEEDLVPRVRNRQKFCKGSHQDP